MYQMRSDIPFPTKQEADEFKAFLHKSAKKRGPWVYLVVKAAMEKELAAKKRRGAA